MSITFANFLTKFNNLIFDNITGTTDGDGSANKDTFVDSALNRYPENFFGDIKRGTQWQAYISTELRTIRQSQSSSGTIIVYKPFSSQVKSASAYALHRFDRDLKKAVINQALNEVYPDFYQMVADETTLDGKGASDNEYEVPSAFEDFPELIQEKQVSGSKIDYIEITKFKHKKVGGTMYFYADITDGNDILLVGKKPLSQFTTDTSETELTDGQASVVALLAASNFCRTISSLVNAKDAGRFDSLAGRYEKEYESKVREVRMPEIKERKLDWGWLRE